jgi:hypothetical protein
MMSEIFAMKKDDQKSLMVRYLGFKQPDNFSVVKKSEARQLDLDISLNVEQIPQFRAGSKMFLNLRVYDLWTLHLPSSEGRRQDYYFQAPFVRLDTTIYQLPENYASETTPKPTDVKCSYGSYSTKYSYNPEKNQLVSIARLELKTHIIPAKDYAEVKTFFDKVNADESQKLIIKKN